MIKYFQQAFKITNENIILTTPLVLFLFILNIYLGFAHNAPSNLPALALLLCTTIFMISAFFSGWFFMVKQAVRLDKQVFMAEEEKAKASFNLLKEIPIGIGEYFIPFIGVLILYTLLFTLFLFFAFKVGMHYIGDLGIKLDLLKTAFSSSKEMKDLILSLSTSQLTRLNTWNLLFIATMSVFSFITMFWPMQVVANTKNPALALMKSLSFLFKNFLGALVLFVYISFLNFTVSFLSALATINQILYFVSMLIYFYFVVYIIVLLFLYYDERSSEKTKNNSNSGSDSIGQNEVGDSESEGN